MSIPAFTCSGLLHDSVALHFLPAYDWLHMRQHAAAMLPPRYAAGIS